MKFSIIIPLYNKEKYIKNTIESVLNQTYDNFELLVIDDSSTDHSYEIVSHIKDNRLKLFKKKNSGVSDTRNFGIKQATNEYLIFLDADDLWKENFLECIIKLQTKYPKAEMFALSYKMKNRIINFRTESETIWISDYFKYAKNNICWTSALCFKKTLIEKIGLFRNGVKRGEDLDYWLRASLATSGIAYYNRPVATYNLIEENSAALSYNNYKESFPYWEWYKESAESPYYTKYVSYMIYTLAKCAFKNKKYQDVLEILQNCKGGYKFIKRTYMKIISFLKK